MTSPGEPESGGAPEPPSALPPSRRRWWHRWKLWLGVLLALPVVLFALYTVGALTWTYSEGQRAGYLQKFSRKGWLCKTWEGELVQPTAPGVAPDVWYFTVRKDAAARQINLALGRKIVAFYEEHRGIPSTCFGETSYFVDSIRIVP
jgi:hypothetical protein